jgi:hypothetical protein
MEKKMKKKIWKILSPLLFCLALGGPALAEIVTLEVTGVVDRIVQNGLTTDDSINYGIPMSGFAVFDTETPDLDSSETVGIYNLISVSMSIGNYTLHDHSTPSDSALFRISYDNRTLWRVASTAAGFDGEIIVNDTPHTSDDFEVLYIQVIDAYGTSSSYSFTDSLPRTSWDLWPFDPLEGRFRMRLVNHLHDSLRIEGELTSMTLIHEPYEPTTYYVDGIDGNDLNDGLSPETAFATIQTAVDATYYGDTVRVANGTYTGDGNRDIEVKRKGITIRSENGPENCIIDCNGSEDEPHIGFYFYRKVPANSNFLSGFTVTNGYSRNTGGGGGIRCGGTNLTISDCNISGNMAFSGRSYGGGGISVAAGIYFIHNCTISGNAGKYCGGISCDGSTLTLRNCNIIGNESLRRGGGVGCYESGLTIMNCTLADNLSPEGSALTCEAWWSQSSVALSNCILWNVGDEIFKDDNSTITISYSNVEDGWPGIDNIDADPCFADPCSGDYHLPLVSPCIDAGDPNYVAEPNETDLDGNPRVINGRIDMGAYESDHIQVRLWLSPRTINRQNRIKRVMAWMKLPEGVSKEQVDEDEGVLLYPGGIEPVKQYVFEHGKKGDKRVSIFAFFDKSELMEAIPDNGQVQLEVVGNLTTSREFYGSGSLTILDRQQPRQWRLLKNQ